MDGYSGKCNRSGIVVPRRAYRLVMRDNTDTRDQNAQFCNRIGCNGRLKYGKSSPLDYAEKPKYSKPSIHSSNGKKTVGSSSRSCCPITSARNSPHDSPRKFSSHLELYSSKSSGVRGESRISKIIPTAGRSCHSQLHPKVRASGAGKVTLTEVGSSYKQLKDTSGRVSHRNPHPRCQNVTGYSLSSTDGSTGSTTSNFGSGNRYGLRNLKCNSISDVLPRGGSPSESKNRRNLLRKRIPDGESSSPSKGKRGNVAPSKEEHVFPSTSGISISSPRRNRNWVCDDDSVASSVMTRRSRRLVRSVNGNARVTRSNHESITALSAVEFQGIIPELPRPDVHSNANHASPYLSSLGASSSASSSYTSEQIGDNIPGISALTSTEHGVTQGLRRHNPNGAAEVLLALERIEQDEELTYEQLLALENNLFFGHHYFYDQHRDMRLDIDNMSYEELLALGDRMGTVSTALSEEAFAKCVKRTIYQTTCLEVRMGGCGEDEADVKCSICQAEYAVGDEIGRLRCEHGYHVTCLQQWLRLKNWCPICKASVAP